MFYCGFDVGSTFCKCIVLNADKEQVLTFLEPIGGEPEEIVHKILKNIYTTLKIKENNLHIEITGRNSEKLLSYIEASSEFKCMALGVMQFNPNIKTIIDSGSFSNKALKLENGKIHDYIVNDICSSGSGIFLELICKSLAININEMEQMALKASTIVPITSQCSIFAESEVIYLMNEGKSVADICAGVCNSIVGRIVPLVAKIKPEPPIAFIGGVAKNKAITLMLEKATGFTIMAINLDPQLVTAYGAAILAIQKGVK